MSCSQIHILFVAVVIVLLLFQIGGVHMLAYFGQKNAKLTIDFGPFSQPREPPQGSLFKRVKSEMLKRKERTAIRKKPIQYQKLQTSLQQKIKQRSFNREEQRDQIVMLQKCKNYFQVRRPQAHSSTPNHSHSQLMVRPSTSCSSSVNRRNFLSQIEGVMKDCGNGECEVKQQLRLFTFYCKMMDQRLQGIKGSIEKKQRML